MLTSRGRPPPRPGARLGRVITPQSHRGTGSGTIHRVLAPVLRALAPFEPWAGGVWLVSAHPDLGGRSPRDALRDGEDPRRIAALAGIDAATSAA